MKATHELALQNVLSVLDTIGASYKIRTSDGTEYSKGFGEQQELFAKKKSRRTRRNLRHLYVPYLEGIQVGEERKVPAQKEVRASELGILVVAWMHRRFSEQGSIIAQNADGSFEVMRIA